MKRLAFQERTIAWSGKKRVFSNQEIKVLSSLIARQFRKAHRNQRVLFRVRSPSGKNLVLGDTFVTSRGLHWRFTRINGIKREIGDFSIMGDTWRLVPLKGQAYQTHQPHKNLVQKITNWILFTRFRPEPSRILQEPADPPPPGTQEREPPSSGETIEHRLRILESLKRDGLITPEEYERKRRQILDSL